MVYEWEVVVREVVDHYSIFVALSTRAWLGFWLNCLVGQDATHSHALLKCMPRRHGS